jgi:glutaminyl-tRNA synthetase
MLSAACHPNKEALGERRLPFTKTLFIDKDDFTEEQGLSRKKFKRLVLGEWVRLRGAYIIKADECVKNEEGEVVEVIASLVPGSLGENVEGIKPRGVVHWVSAEQCVQAEVRLYDRLFNHPNPDSGDEDFKVHINPNSYETVTAMLEPSLKNALPEQIFQFEREGYFVADRYDHNEGHLIFNRTIGLRDVWSGK